MIVKILFGVACAVFFYWMKRRERSAKSYELPPPPLLYGSLPLIGHAYLFLGDTANLWKQLKRLGQDSLKRGGAVTMSIGSWTIHVLTDPDDCLKVAKTCLNKDYFYEMTKPWVGDGLISASETIWKRHHRLLTPAFSQQVLDGYMEEFNRQGRKLVNNFAAKVNKGPFDHRNYIEVIALDIVYRSAIGFGDDDDDENKEKFMAKYTAAMNKMHNNIIDRVQSLWLHNDYLYYLTPHRRRRDELIKELHEMTYTVIQKGKIALKKKKNLGENTTQSGGKNKSFFSLLMELAADGSFTDKEVREETDTLLSAGFDTTNSFVTCILTFLGSFPDVQDKVFKELHDVFGDSDRDVEKQDISKLVYLDAVLKEVLRICPVIPVVSRHLDNDVQLKRHTLPAGGTCFLFFYSMHRHPVWGADAEDFKPERFLSRESNETLNAFAGFSFGRRICIGQKFAMMSAKTLVAHVLRKYQVSADHRNMEFKLDIALKPISGHYITLKHRT